MRRKQARSCFRSTHSLSYMNHYANNPVGMTSRSVPCRQFQNRGLHRDCPLRSTFSPVSYIFEIMKNTLICATSSACPINRPMTTSALPGKLSKPLFLILLGQLQFTNSRYLQWWFYQSCPSSNFWRRYGSHLPFQGEPGAILADPHIPSQKRSKFLCISHGEAA